MSNRDRKTWSPAEPPGCHVGECPYLATYCPNHSNRIRVALYVARKAVESFRLQVSR